jgi:hypothetical protein
MTEEPDNTRPGHHVLGSLALLAAGCLAAAVLVVPLFRGTNCGGNSAALTICATYVTFLEWWTSGHPGEEFHYQDADPEIQKQITGITDAPSIGSVLANVDGVHIDPSAPRRVVVVCDQAFDNVPNYLLWRAPMAHAVGYSTGEIGLISPEEFSSLDLSGFVDLRAQIPTVTD